jgi:hypothetical protein
VSTVTRSWKAGSIDCKKVVQLKVVDLERYRGKAREEVRVSVAAQLGSADGAGYRPLGIGLPSGIPGAQKD